MKIVSPKDTYHEIKFIPRYAPTSTLNAEIYNESIQTEETISTLYTIFNGILTLSFIYNFTFEDKYQIKIKEGENIVYRGKLFAGYYDGVKIVNDGIGHYTIGDWTIGDGLIN